jgi:hypothetical protein
MVPQLSGHPAGYAELHEDDQQMVDDLIARVTAKSDPSVRKAILDEALASVRPAPTLN